MELEFKKDFNLAQKRLEAWWNCEIIDRPCIQMTVENEEYRVKNSELEKEHESWRDRWFDLNFQLQQAQERMKAVQFWGEAFPAFVPNLGPDLWATLYGAKLEFSRETSWAVHFVEDWDEFLKEKKELKPDFDNQYWQFIENMTRVSLKEGKGKFLTGLPDFHPGADLLAALRDVDELCLDLIRYPEKIKKINDRLIEYYPEIYDRLYEIIKKEQAGTTTWLSVFHKNKFYVPSSDFSALISNEMFKDIFLPGIMKQIEFLDRSIYHLDGPDALRHLDTILAIDELNGLQWVYGAGNGPSTRWINVYKKVQKAGKCMQILVQEPEEIEILMDELSPEGLLFSLGQTLSKKEGEEVLNMISDKM